MEALIPQGIQRNMPGQNCPDGACEEIINARYKDGAWQVVGLKEIIVGDVDYEQVFVHQYGDFKNYIGLRRGTVIWFDAATKAEKQVICQCSGDVSFNQVNNILLIRDRENIFKTIFADDVYDSIILSMPEVPTMEFTKPSMGTGQSGYVKKVMQTIVSDDGSGSSCGTDNKQEYQPVRDFNPPDRNGYLRLNYVQSDVKDLTTTLESVYNGMLNVDDYQTSGYILVSIAYQLYDGSITKQSPPRLLTLGDIYHPGLFYIKNFDYTWNELNPDVTVEGYFQPTVLEGLNISVKNLPDYETYKNIIKKINVYASRPIRFYDFENADVTYLNMKHDGKLYNLRMSEVKRDGIPRKVLAKTDVENLLMYRALQFDFGNGPKEQDVKFSDLTTNPTMPVDATGWFNTTGDMLVYNNRLHIYNINQIYSKSQQMLSVKIDTDYPANVSTMQANYVVYIKNPMGDNRISLTGKAQYIRDNGNINIYLPDFISFPDTRAYKTDVIMEIDSKRYKYTVFLEPSATYNFAFFTVKNDARIFRCEEAAAMKPELLAVSDKSKILVSEHANPYYFPPQHSYLAPGEVKALAVNTEQISASQVGQFPLYIFTTEGIYALQVGDGNVLYSNMIPVSTEIANNSNVVQTKYGIVFTTDEGVKLISGIEVVNLSEPVNGEIDQTIRNCTAFRNAVTDARLYNIWDVLSQNDFRAYIKNAVMGYERTNDELIVSDPSKGYSYVYSFPEKMWYKITETFNGFSRSIAYSRGSGGSSVVDLTAEQQTTRTFHLQTRPLKLGSAGFKRFARMAARGRFLPQAGRYFSMYVFGSQNLSDWKLLTGKQVNRNTIHLVLQGIPHTYRYAVIVIGGDVLPGHLLTQFETAADPALNNKIR